MAAHLNMHCLLTTTDAHSVPLYSIYIILLLLMLCVECCFLLFCFFCSYHFTN